VVGLAFTTVWNVFLTNDVEELVLAYNSTNGESFTMFVLVVVSAILGVCLTFFFCLMGSIGGPLMAHFTGNFKDCFLTTAGFIFFEDIVPSRSIIQGLLLSLTGAGYYTFIKYREEFSKKKPEAETKIKSN